jgi:hypothetical protein
MTHTHEADRPLEDSKPVGFLLASVSKDSWISLSGVQGLRP